MSARAAGIPKPTHSSPPVPELTLLSEALPLMGIVLCCVWAAYTTIELPELAASTVMYPEVVAPSNNISLLPYEITVEPTELAASTAEPPKVSVVLNYQLLVCPVLVKETVACPVTARRAAPELSSSPEPAMEADCELLSCPDLAKVVFELTALTVIVK